MGLSPRERGNLPTSGLGGDGMRWVYPRASGGTPDSVSTVNPPCGLSPRERGTTLTLEVPLPQTGLSPRERGNQLAQRRRRDSRLHRVYPRASGGTIVSLVGQHDSLSGVYPRASGGTASWRESVPFGARPGSIPARAGEPL